MQTDYIRCIEFKDKRMTSTDILSFIRKVTVKSVGFSFATAMLISGASGINASFSKGMELLATTEYDAQNHSVDAKKHTGAFLISSSAMVVLAFGYMVIRGIKPQNSPTYDMLEEIMNNKPQEIDIDD
jgi:hypothetical protein